MMIASNVVILSTAVITIHFTHVKSCGVETITYFCKFRAERISQNKSDNGFHLVFYFYYSKGNIFKTNNCNFFDVFSKTYIGKYLCSYFVILNQTEYNKSNF